MAQSVFEGDVTDSVVWQDASRPERAVTYSVADERGICSTAARLDRKQPLHAAVEADIYPLVLEL